MIVSILFCSCSNGNKDNNKISNDYTIKTQTSDNSEHLDYKLQDKLIINADLEYEKNKSSYNTYEAKLKIFDKKSCRSVLMPEKLVTDEFHEDAGEPLSRNVTTDYYLMENEGNVSLAIGGTMLNYEKPNYDSIYYAFNLNENSDLYNANKYSTNTELDFMDRSTAFSKVKSILSNLDIKIDDNYSCYSLDKDTMTKEYHYVEMSEDDNHEKTHSFDKSEECYCFVLSETVGELPLSKYSYGNSDSGTYVSGTEIMAYYGKSGLIMLDVYCPYDVVKSKNSENIITLDEAIDKLNDKYKNMIITDKIEITKISLNYTAVMENADDNKYTLVPSWIFEVTQTFEDHSESYDIMFNAITGAEFV
jgi:hypothetical protein